MINKMDDRDSFGYFVAGFVSGEGSFFVVLLERPGRRPQAHCGFSIRVRADDAELVRSIWRALGYPGAVHSVPTHRYQYANDSVRRHDATMLIVRSRTELIGQVIPFFDRYSLRGVKRRNYDLWKKAVYLLEAGEHLTAEGMEKIVALRATLNKYQGHDETPPACGADKEVGP